MRNGRYFQNMTEETLERLLEEIKVFGIEEMQSAGDVREGREEEKWVNVIAEKCTNSMQ